MNGKNKRRQEVPVKRRTAAIRSQSLGHRLALDFRKNKLKYLMVIPILILLFLFCYRPMYGILIAFKRYRPALGVWDSPWVGFRYFRQFFRDPYCWRLFRNTLTISGLNLIFGFPAPIILALLLNEVRSKRFKKAVQTVSYMPHFISTVVVCGMITTFCASDGLFNNIIEMFGGTRSNLLQNKNLFYPIYIISDIWKGIGWDSIIYLAALSGIDQEQYEAAKIDGASRLQQMFYITLPGLMPTVSMLLILRIGSLLSVGYEKIILLYQPTTYEVADVISSYVYRRGLMDGEFSYGTAVGLFNSIVSIILLLLANKASKKLGQSGLF
ncbi:MAG TPA: sugar ABC transporter permease [Candidatus Caccomorpha excrementavium]|nr:sugar ABC transporter permease [Candidatus Caccomorpha excrementavium]